MAGRGPTPDPRRKRTSGGQAPWQELPPAPSRRLRRIPSAPTEAGWHDNSVRWWKAMAKSAIAVLYEESDWAYLETLLALVERHWRDGCPIEVAKEIRLGGGKLGATIDNRQRLRMRPTGAASPHPQPKRGRSAPADDEAVDVDDPINPRSDRLPAQIRSARFPQGAHLRPARYM